VLDQAQVEGQLLARQALEQRQHEVPAVAVEEVVGVLDAGANAAQLVQAPQLQTVQQGLRGGGADFGENGHGRSGRAVRVTAKFRSPARARRDARR
jgi:hypothetical protein